jgi:hypothetical protein
MPDFDTRKPQVPDRPSKLHMFVAAGRQLIFSVGRLSNRMMVRNSWVRSAVRHRWGVGFSILSLVILAAILIVWSDFGNPFEEAANQSSQAIPEYTAEHQDDESDCYVTGGDGSNAAGTATCYDVYMKATDEKQLPRVASDVVFGGGEAISYVARVSFYDPGGSSAYATAFYFADKEAVPPCVTLGREQLDSATVWDGIYVLRGDVGGEGEGTTCDAPGPLSSPVPGRPGGL